MNKHANRITLSALTLGLALGLAACGEEEAAPTPNNPANSAGANTPNVQTVAVNTVCPVSGEEADPAVTVEYEEATIAFCCNDCKGEWDAADAEAKAAFAAKAAESRTVELGG